MRKSFCLLVPSCLLSRLLRVQNFSKTQLLQCTATRRFLVPLSSRDFVHLPMISFSWHLVVHTSSKSHQFSTEATSLPSSKPVSTNIWISVWGLFLGFTSFSVGVMAAPYICYSYIPQSFVYFYESIPCCSNPLLKLIIIYIKLYQFKSLCGFSPLTDTLIKYQIRFF